MFGNRKLVLGSLLFFWGLALALILPELLLRMTYREEEINGNYWGIGAFESFEQPAAYRHTPGFKGRSYRAGAFDVDVEISELGLRQKNADSQMDFPERLLVLGDSYVFGLGVGEEETFAWLLQEPLNRLGVGVINGGQTGYSPEQEIGFGKFLIEATKPQMVALCLFLDNDIEADYRQTFRNIEIKDGYRLPGDRWCPGGSVDFFRTRSYLWMFTEHKVKSHSFFRKAHFRFQRLAGENPEEAIQPTVKALTRFAHYCESRNIRFGIVLLPYYAAGRIFYDPMLAALESGAIPYVDLVQSANFDEGDRFSIDNHWNASGHQKAASHLLAFVKQLKANSD